MSQALLGQTVWSGVPLCGKSRHQTESHSGLLCHYVAYALQRYLLIPTASLASTQRQKPLNGTEGCEAQRGRSLREVSLTTTERGRKTQLFTQRNTEDIG